MEPILLTQYPADGVAVLRLNRPGVLNALNLALRQALAERIAANPPQALRWTKQLLHQGRQGTLDDALNQAGVLQGQAHQTDD
ncbi:MAG: hypothetical protein RIR92_601, partial [Pseudomonadota bacterium]